MVAVAAVPAERIAPERLVYRGELRTLYRIAAVNLLLSIVTLGFYRFWGRTRLRQYMWHAILLDGDPLEWTGTGWEMCRGFLIAAAAALVAYAPIYALTLAGPDFEILLAVYQVAFGAIVLVLAGFVAFLALRYRLSRTRWRGIRGDLEGSPWPYAWLQFGWWLLIIPTFLLAVPFATVALRRHLIRHARLGNLSVECQARGGAVFPAFLVSIAVGAGFVGLLSLLWGAGIFGAIVTAVLVDLGSAGSLGFVLILAFAALIGSAYPCVTSIYHASLYRHLAESSSAAGLSVRTTVAAGSLFGLRFTNFVIIMVTLGIGLPLVWHRQLRFFAEHTAVIGIESAERIAQGQNKPTRASEGMLEILDVGAV